YYLNFVQCSLIKCVVLLPSYFYCFNDTVTTIIYSLSLHDALPIYIEYSLASSDISKREEAFNTLVLFLMSFASRTGTRDRLNILDRKSTRLNSSHVSISYAVFCLIRRN